MPDTHTFQVELQELALNDRDAPSETMPNLLSSAGIHLRELRNAARLTQIEIANRMKTTQPALARFEKGACSPNLTTIERYAAALSRRAMVSVWGPGYTRDRSLDDSGTLANTAVGMRTMDLSEVIGELTKRRKNQGFTQTYVAKLMDTTQPMIARLERCEGSPNVRTLERYADAVDVRMELHFEPQA
jgi:transcriptional regulator with XRE-family HTH domain